MKIAERIPGAHRRKGIRLHLHIVGSCDRLPIRFKRDKGIRVRGIQIVFVSRHVDLSGIHSASDWIFTAQIYRALIDGGDGGKVAIHQSTEDQREARALILKV